MKYTATAFAFLFQSSVIFAQSSLIEDQSLRCSSLALVHTSLSLDYPEFGQHMTDLGMLYSMVYGVHRSFRLSVDVMQGEVLESRDATTTALGMAWRTNPEDVITEAAICNSWRADIVDSIALNGGDLSDDLSPALILRAVKDPPTRTSVEEVEKWRDITSLAFETWIDMGSLTSTSARELIRESLKE